MQLKKETKPNETKPNLLKYTDINKPLFSV